MEEIPVGTWMASLTGAGAGIAVTIIHLAALHYGWTRERLLRALLLLVSVTIVLVTISVALVNRDLGPSWLRLLAPAGPTWVLIVLLWEWRKLLRKHDRG